MVAPFAEVLLAHGPFGCLAAVSLPSDLAPVPPEVFARLDPEEQSLGRELKGRRQVAFVGGRIAFRMAAASARLPTGPLLTGPRGEPTLPPGVAGSIAHKRTLAIALVGPSSRGTLGVDLEELLPDRSAIARRVLRPEEVAAVTCTPPEARWREILLRFSVKEALYKALHPLLRRYVHFDEASVAIGPGDDVGLVLHLRGRAPALLAAARFREREGLVIAEARVTTGPSVGAKLDSGS
jgi:4'-phosphopantetheinyl transferase EntD